MLQNLMCTHIIGRTHDKIRDPQQLYWENWQQRWPRSIAYDAGNSGSGWPKNRTAEQTFVELAGVDGFSHE